MNRKPYPEEKIISILMEHEAGPGSPTCRGIIASPRIRSIDGSRSMAARQRTGRSDAFMGLLRWGGGWGLREQGFTIFVPLSEYCAFDLVAYSDGEFRRVQVKYRAPDAFGKVDVKFSTSWADRHGTHTSLLDNIRDRSLLRILSGYGKVLLSAPGQIRLEHAAEGKGP